MDDLESAKQLQFVCSLEMIHHTVAHAHRLVPGNAVMSPWEPGVRRYGPGVVTAKTEHQDSLSADGRTSLWVRMWSGCVALVPRSLVVHIPTSDYSRIVRELQQGVSSLSHSWPCTPTPPWGCQSAPHHRHPTTCCWPRCVCGLESRDGCERAELEKQASLLSEDLAATETARSKSPFSMAGEGVKPMVSSPRVRLKRDQNRPPWRYWRRSTPEPQHRKPVCNVRLALVQSALRLEARSSTSRPRSAERRKEASIQAWFAIRTEP
ncbi:hypothetical protein CRUP_027783 [Coryphaenoides rupestris]|nr:hypothetical protein CRUP_027783 [Coryphaenoides rupestris]